MRARNVLPALIVVALLLFTYQNCAKSGVIPTTGTGQVSALATQNGTSAGTMPTGFMPTATNSPAPATHPALLVGFFGASVKGIGDINGDGDGKLTYDYVHSVAPLSNVVVVGSDDVADVVARVHRAASLGQQSVIMLQYLLYPWKTPPSGTAPARTFVPDANYRAIFDGLVTALGPDVNQVAGWYIFDEPYKQNYCAGNTPLTVCGGVPQQPNNMVPTGTMRTGLDAVIAYVKSKSSAPTMILFSPDVEVPNAQFTSVMLPPSVDLYGVDCYVAFGAICTDAAIAQLTNTLKAARGPNQKLMFVLDGMGGPSDQSLNFRDRLWAHLIGDNLAITGFVMSFLWQNSPQDGLIGLVSLPLARDAISIYNAGYQDQVVCDGPDLRNVATGVVWTNAPYCAPNCESGSLVTRSIKGVVLNRVPSAQCP